MPNFLESKFICTFIIVLENALDPSENILTINSPTKNSANDIATMPYT